jgi:hypothetical protein
MVEEEKNLPSESVLRKRFQNAYGGDSETLFEILNRNCVPTEADATKCSITMLQMIPAL